MDYDSFTWLRYVALSGDEGERWVEDFEAFRPLVQVCRECVKELRATFDHRRSGERLQGVRAALDALQGTADPSLLSATERWYYGALGFHFYSQRAFDEADDSMRRAHTAVIRTVDRSRCLTGLAYDCFELELHRARIARDRFRWDEMRERAATSAAMRDGTRPLCVLSDGTPIAIADVRRFYRTLPLTDEDREALGRIMDEQSTGAPERFVHRMFRLTGFVIEYL